MTNAKQLPAPMLTPRDIADLLAVSVAYVVGEIEDGRLPARERQYDSGRKRYRIEVSDFVVYARCYWPGRLAKASNQSSDFDFIASLASDGRDDAATAYFEQLRTGAQADVLAFMRAAAMFVNHRHGAWAARLFPTLKRLTK